jgi:methyl-accepting chemotaxis protein
MYAGTIVIVLLTIGLMGGLNFWRMRSSLFDLGQSFMHSALNHFLHTVSMQNDITQENINADLVFMSEQIDDFGAAYLDETQTIEMTITNQITKQTERVRIPTLKIGSMVINNNFELVDKVQAIVGGTATIFQVLPGKLLRVSTNVKKLDGSRAVGTYIPASSPVYQTVMSGKTFRGRAFVVNAWYLTAYKPLRDPSGKIVAVIYVGRKIMTPQLLNLLKKFKIKGKGEITVFNSKGEIIFHPDQLSQTNITDFEFGQKMLQIKEGKLDFEWEGEPTTAFIHYFEPWDWYIAISLKKSDLFFGMDKVLFSTSAITGSLALVLAVILIFFLMKNLTKILRNVANACRKFADGHYDTRIDYATKDVIGETVSAINDMARAIQDRIFLQESFRDGITAPMFTVSVKDRVVQYANDAICELTGRSKEETIGKLKGYELLNYSSFEECQVCKPVAEIVIPQGRPWAGEVSFKHKNGEEKIVLVNAFPVKDREGQTVEAVIILQDVTDIRKNEEIMARQAETLREAAASITEITDLMASASDQLSAQIEQTTRGAELQKQRAEETATAMEEMNATVLEVAKNASNAAENTEAAKNKALDGSKIVHDALKAIEQAQELTSLVKENVNQLGQKAEDIGEVINVITDIADQTNLLALNAAIEAARAGEHGRGFAVVADEVRKLAEKTMAATKEVGEVISSIQEGTRKNIEDTDRAAQAVQQSTELATKSGQALQEIVRIAEENADQVRAIATASEEQSAASEEITRAVEEINQISAETSSGMQEAAQAIAELASQAQKLKDLVQKMQS